VSGLCRPGF